MAVFDGGEVALDGVRDAASARLFLGYREAVGFVMTVLIRTTWRRVYGEMGRVTQGLPAARGAAAVTMAVHSEMPRSMTGTYSALHAREGGENVADRTEAAGGGNAQFESSWEEGGQREARDCREKGGMEAMDDKTTGRNESVVTRQRGSKVARAALRGWRWAEERRVKRKVRWGSRGGISNE